MSETQKPQGSEHQNKGQTQDIDVTELEQRIQKLEDQKNHWMAKATDYEKRYKDIDPSEVSAQRTELSELRRKVAGGDTKQIDDLINKERGELEKRYSTKFTELSSTVETQAKELKSLRVMNVAVERASKLFNSDGISLLKYEFDQELDFSDGQIVIRDGDKARASKADPRRTMDLDEYLSIKLEKYPSLAKPEVRSGVKPTGKTFESNGPVSGIPSDFHVWPREKQSEFFKNHPDLHRQVLRSNKFS